MSPDSPLKIQPLEKYRGAMTKEQVAEALGVASHIIPPLTRAGLFKPLGRPQRYCVNRYSRDVLAQQLADVNLARQAGGGHPPALAHQERAQAGQAGWESFGNAGQRVRYAVATGSAAGWCLKSSAPSLVAWVISAPVFIPVRRTGPQV
jgi:hypothetical protein